MVLRTAIRSSEEEGDKQTNMILALASRLEPAKNSG